MLRVVLVERVPDGPLGGLPNPIPMRVCGQPQANAKNSRCRLDKLVRFDVRYLVHQHIIRLRTPAQDQRERRGRSAMTIAKRDRRCPPPR